MCLPYVMTVGTCATTGEDARATLADALRNGAVGAVGSDLTGQALYHGVAPLLFARRGIDAFRAEARARAMWDLGHRIVLTRILATMEVAGIECLVMKGSALAYDLYAQAGLRPRGDSDLLVAPASLAAARAVLRDLGFAAAFGERPATSAGQEVWTLTGTDGIAHDIDLHWAVFNGPALAGLISVDEAFAEARALPRLAPGARAFSHVHSLLHACIHRAQHILSPYFVGGEAHYGGDRLIWLCDIDLLARVLDTEEWARFRVRATDRGIAPVCHAALADAARLLGTPVPADIAARLGTARGGGASEYLIRSNRAGRAFADLRASGWHGALRHGLARLFPAPALLRSQYPDSRQPLIVLYLRRIGRFLTGGRQ